MLASAAREFGFELVLPNTQATRRLALDVATILAPGDVITLSGDLGAGKTTLARALIRHLAADASVDVPSPTFTLAQVYALPRFPVVHVDLYRVASPGELVELGFEDEDARSVVLIEWPDRAGDALTADRLDIALTVAPQLGASYRRAKVTGHGSFAARAERLAALGPFLAEAGFGEAERTHMQGDASTRSYERLSLRGRRAVLMNAPRRPDGPPLRGGLSYGEIAHLAEDVKPFVALARALRERGLSSPEIYAADLEHGYLVLEDLGSEGIVAGSPPAPIEERYTAAVDALVALHRHSLPHVLEVTPGIEHRLPYYDIEAFLIEVELLLDWYFPLRRIELAAAARAEFLGLWREALLRAIAAAPTWVLRDYHSPNLLWLADREGVARVGLLDFQDAQMGPAAYDVVSLLQDARVDVPESLEIALLGRYAKARRSDDPDFDPARFVELYAMLGAQRATKILGIFARLDRRDRKPQYLRHLSRIWRYLGRSLSHRTLAPLRAWYDGHAAPPTS